MKKALKDKKYIKFENKIIMVFMELLGEKEHIQVPDILNKAGISRATLYAHFKSVEDIYTGLEKYLAELMTNEFFKKLKYYVNNVDKYYDTIFKYIDKHYNSILRVCKSSHIGGIIMHTTQGMYKKMIEANMIDEYILKNYFQNSIIPAYGYIGSTITAIFGKLIEPQTMTWDVTRRYCADTLYRQSYDVWKRVGLLEKERDYWSED